MHFYRLWDLFLHICPVIRSVALQKDYISKMAYNRAELELFDTEISCSATGKGIEDMYYGIREYFNSLSIKCIR